jgi:GTPase SAR1 family protein
MIIGNGSAGKTSTVRSLLSLPFDREHKSTEIVDAEKVVQIMQKQMNNWKQQKPTVGKSYFQDDFVTMAVTSSARKVENKEILDIPTIITEK